MYCPVSISFCPLDCKLYINLLRIELRFKALSSISHKFQFDM